MILGLCPKGARATGDKESLQYSVAHGLTETDHFNSRQEMVRCYCEVVCQKTQRDACVLLNMTFEKEPEQGELNLNTFDFDVITG